jgi:Signal transduction histidine kinase
MRFTIRSKLLIGVLTVSLLVTAVNINAYYYNDKLNRSFDSLIDRRVEMLNKATEIQYHAMQQLNNLRGYLLTQEQFFLEDLKENNEQLTDSVAEVEAMVIDPEINQLFEGLVYVDQAFIDRTEHLLTMLENNGDHEEAIAYFKSDVMPFGQQLGPLATRFAEEQRKQLDQNRKDNTKMVDFVNQMTAILTIITFLLTLLIGFFLSHRITRNLQKITRVITVFTHDSTRRANLPHIEVQTQDEIGDIARAFNEMGKTLEEYAMLEEEQRWLENNVGEMAIKFQGVHSLEPLAQLFITTITPLVDAVYGVFYMKQGSSNRPQLNKIAAYADQQENIGTNSFLFGEGLVGQAAMEGRTILLNDLPDNYVHVASGLGQASPSHLLIMPIQFEGQVIAVFELASFGTFTLIQQTLLQRVATQLGSVLNSIMGRMQIERLLVESQTLSEELQTQSEELQLQQEELRGINEKLEEQYRNSEHKTRELEKTKSQLEEKARQLALSSQYKSEFLANMSHELRTPLNSLLILSNILAENTSGNLTENQIKYASTIHQSGNDLLRLINDILDLSKIESGKIDLVTKPLTLNYICDFVEQQFYPVARQKGIEFITILEPDLPAAIVTDEQRVMQIIKNLLSNAFKFTERGEVKLHIHRALHNLPLDGENSYSAQDGIAFSVYDTGIGIPEDKQGLIFQAFQQADGTTNRKYGGTGLGLSISLNIAHLLGGDIFVSSVVGQGSVFTLVLPGSKKSAEDRPEAVVVYEEVAAATALQPIEEPQPQRADDEPDDALWAGKKVLIVDDDMRNVYATTIALESRKMNVLFAENGISCLKLLKEHPDVDLVLMDIMLPELDGYETMRSLRQTPGFESLPVIALTAKAMKDDREKCLRAGASDYISKPVKLEQLFARMKIWLTRQVED